MHSIIKNTYNKRPYLSAVHYQFVEIVQLRKMIYFGGIETFKFEQEDIQIVTLKHNNEIFVIANPITKFLEFTHCNLSVNNHVAKENQVLLGDVHPTGKLNLIQFNPRMKCINFKGVFELINKSKITKAYAFRMWLCDYVMPILENPIFDYGNWCIANNQLISQIKQGQHHYGSIYIATNSKLMQRNIYNIGKTTDLNECLAGFNHFSPEDFYFLFVFNTDQMIEIEKYLHLKLMNYKYNKNFFALSDIDLHELLNLCIKFINKNKKSLKIT